MLGILLMPLLVVGCFLLLSQGFGKEGIPLTNSKRITGNAGKILGVLCGILGLVFFVLWLFMVKGSM